MPPKNKQKGFLAPLTPKRQRKEAAAMTRLRYRPVQRQLHKNLRASRQRKQNIRKMFGSYREGIGKRADTTASAYQSARDQIGQSSDTAASYAEQLRQRMAQEAQSSANLRGVKTDTSGSNVNAQAQLARINAANLLKGVTASQGASQAAHLKDKQGIAQRESVQQRLNEQARARGFREDITELKREEGDYKASLRPQARESERQYHLGLLAAKDRKSARRFAAAQNRKGRKFSAKQGRQERKGALKKLRKQNTKLQRRLNKRR